MRHWRWAVLVALTACLAGCATLGERETAASRAALRFADSVRQADGPRACAALAPETRQELEQSAESPCPEALLQEDLTYDGRVRSVQVYGQQARVVLDTDTLFLSRFPTGWRITAAGCEPRPQRPYQCQVKGG
ncbi:hypothetical protein RKD23_003663 [Streptomyces sp. SAI-170]|uniref:hypothetical protein n=1 Tax=Streptomyces sp. SAI-170 TaxID=3377729 RepID=UPI003C7B10F4